MLLAFTPGLVVAFLHCLLQRGQLQAYDFQRRLLAVYKNKIIF